MLDDNLDPTPLLKEIRDDKVATIIIDANASVSYLILKKVSTQWKKKKKAASGDSPTHYAALSKFTFCCQPVCRTQRGARDATVATFHAAIWEIRVEVVKGTPGLLKRKRKTKKQQGNNLLPVPQAAHVLL